MFTIGVDTSAVNEGFKAHALRGAGRYVSELVGYLKEHSSSTVKIHTFDAMHTRGSAFVDRITDCIPLGKNTIKQQLLFPQRLANDKVVQADILHFPAHIDAPAWCPKAFVVTVLDLIPIVLSDLYSAGKASWRFKLARWLELQAIKKAALVLAISEHTAKDVHEILGVPYEKIVVTPLGVDQQFFHAELRDNESDLRQRFGVPLNRKIIIYVGGIDQRKNMPTLLKSFKAVLDSEKEQGRGLPVLLMVGAIQNDAEFPKLLQLIKALDLTDDVVMPGYIGDAELLQIYAIATVFFFPSLYEGFGLPPLEALAAGVPVVSSGTSAMPEVLGDAAVIFDPNDCVAAQQALTRILNDDLYANELSVRGKKQAATFSWQRTGETTLAAYEQLGRAQGLI
ncbi:glycosyltransferase family 4 protein [Oligoflexia bacterium]|nr:glycosyltransferase family 4 protein [Oligoflexia bacterium]